MVRGSLEKSLIVREYGEFPDAKSFHGAARIFEMLQSYSAKLPSDYPIAKDELFLMEEVNVLEESREIYLPNFLPRSAFRELLKRKINSISGAPNELIHDVWSYIENPTIKIMSQHFQKYPQIQSSSQMVVHDLIAKLSSKSYQFVKTVMEMESFTHYTSNPDYTHRWMQLMADKMDFMDGVLIDSAPTIVFLEAYGAKVDVKHLRLPADIAGKAFDIRMRLMAYWNTVLLRLIDGMVLHISHSIKCLVETDLETELIDELVGPTLRGVHRMMEKSPATAAKRERLKKTVELLRQSKEVVAKIMGQIGVEVDH